MNFDSQVVVSCLAELSRLPDVKGGAFYVISVVGPWRTTATKAFHENLDAFSEALGENLLVVLRDHMQITAARSIFQSTEFDDPTIVITSTKPDKWHAVLETPKAIKVSFGGLEDWDVVVNNLMKITVALNEKGEDSFRQIGWDAKIAKIRQVIGKIPIVSLIGLAV